MRERYGAVEEYEAEMTIFDPEGMKGIRLGEQVLSNEEQRSIDAARVPKVGKRR